MKQKINRPELEECVGGKLTGHYEAPGKSLPHLLDVLHKHPELADKLPIVFVPGGGGDGENPDTPSVP